MVPGPGADDLGGAAAVRGHQPAGDPRDVTVSQALVAVHTEQRARLLASLIRLAARDIDAAEDALADAMTAALDAWTAGGVPESPGAWILTAARRRLLDRARQQRRRRTDPLPDDPGTLPVEAPLSDPEPDTMPDDLLRLIFTCCHPALALQARVALTLRTVGGLTTPEIARAFVEAEPTTAQRIVRAKQKIRMAGIPYVVPGDRELPIRLEGVLEVLYLVFNEGYGASSGDDFVRRDLCEQAMRLTAQTVSLLPFEPEPIGLLALMEFHHARRDGRVGGDGAIVPLEEQPRDRWDRAQIAVAHGQLIRALVMGRPGPYQLQAAIAGLHAQAPTAAETDWPQIVQLYQKLLEWRATPVVELNHAVALAMAKGPEWGLALLDGLSDRLSGYHLFHAARADLHRRLDERDAARSAYAAALALVTHPAERKYLERRRREVSDAADAT
jgi:RNA polymerase sigma-70 factor (ECF subfamily)